MEGNTIEINPTTVQDQSSPASVIKPQTEQSPEQANKLATKFAEVRANTLLHVQKVKQLLGENSVEAETQEPEKPVDSTDVLVQLRTLAKEESISPTEFVSKSREALITAAQIRKQVDAEQKELEKQKLSQEDDIRWVIDERVKDLDRARGIKKLSASLEKRYLGHQRVAKQERLDYLKSQIITRQQLYDQIKNEQVPVLKKQEQIIYAEIGNEVRAIKKDYGELLQDIFQDDTITAEIRGVYIQQVIAPVVDKFIEAKEFPASKKEDFYATLQTCIDHREEPEEQKQVNEEKLEDFYRAGVGYNLRAYCSPLLDGHYDKEIVQFFVSKIAAGNIKFIEGELEFYLKHYQEESNVTFSSQNRAWEVVRDAIEPQTALGNSIQDQMGRPTTSLEYEYMQLWHAMQSSQAANKVFDETLRQQDKEFYSTTMDRSFTHQEDIGLLYYYPTPEAIRNLVLMTAVDKLYGLGSAINATKTLEILAKRPDWRQCLDNAEATFPLLKTIRPVLESGDWKEQSSHQNTQPIIDSLSIAIINGKPDNIKLRDLAGAALPNSVILDILIKKGTINEATKKTINEVDVLLKSLEYETPPYQVVHPYCYLQNKLRGTLKDTVLGYRFESDSVKLINRLSVLARKVLDNQSNFSTLDYFLSEEVVEVIAGKKVDSALVFQFPEYARALLDEKFKETRSFIYNHSDTLLQNVADLKFLNSIVGEFGQKADPLIRGYQECLAAGAMSATDKELILEFARQFRVISPATMAGYKEAKEAGHEKVYIAQLESLAERMTGSGTFTEEERKKPFYKDLLRHVFSNNAGNYGSFESNESCPDRSSDLAEFKIKPRYEIDLLSQSEIRVKEGETLDISVKESVQKPILEIAEKMNALSHDKEKIQVALQENVDKTLHEILEKGGLQGVDLTSITTTDEKLFLILTDSIYGSRSIDPNAIKNLMITYEFANFEDISDYIAGTSDRVGRASNQDYALLCEVGTFYSDRIKEVNRRLVQAAWNNPTIVATMPEYFKKLAQDTTMAQRKDMINRLQIDRLGTSESFIKQVGKMLEKRKGRKYTSDEVKDIIQRYERYTGGLAEKASTSQKPETKAFYGQLRSQRERTFEALKAITGQEVDPKQTYLGEIDLQQVLNTEASIREGKYDEEQFASYTVQRFIDLFEDERTKIDGELAKFESLSGKQREILHGYITKSKESANARMVGGVCVAGDNPDKHPNQNIWSMPNYLQMVFQEPDTLQCQGLVLLHHFNEGGKKILTASYNPSSTYLYSVDEAALFNGITNSLEQFAKENGFDILTVPRNKTIRTNRTGGEFEKSMDKKIAQVGKSFKFETAKQFSYHPIYQIQEMDIIWERNIT